MRILYDGVIFKMQRAGGINRYIAEVISGLPADYHPIVTGAEDFGKNAPSHPNLVHSRFDFFRPKRISTKLHNIFWKPHVLRGINLFHPTYYELSRGYSLSDFKCPMVTTVHDMTHARFPLQSDDAERVINAQRQSVLRADRIVCVSKSTERDLLEFYPDMAGKITVIYHGTSFAVNNTNGKANVFENPSFLYIGGRWGYKNFQLILRAFAKAASVARDIQLTVAGYPLTNEEKWQLHFLGITDRVKNVVFPEEAALEKLYQQSTALLYPSRYEGFGMPPLEAMSCGTIPVTADTTSLPEVVGDAGFLLDPANEDLWADCIIKLSRPFADRPKYLERGRQRAKQFTWEECARRHVEIYKQLS